MKPAETTAVDFSNILKKFNINITKSDEETGNTHRVTLLRWLNRQVVPTLKMVMKLDKVNGTDYIDTMLEQAKLTEKHEKILQQQSAEMNDIITKQSED